MPVDHPAAVRASAPGFTLLARAAKIANSTQADGGAGGTVCAIQDEDQSFRKMKLRCEDVQGRNVLTNFWVCRLAIPKHSVV
jgi:hypothetical protein